MVPFFLTPDVGVPGEVLRGRRMRLPFSIAEFLEIFRSYNLAIWPAQGILYLLGVALVVLARRGSGPWARWGVVGGLALLWAWTGAVYHIAFFSRINPAARLFGALFLVQATLCVVWAVRTSGLRFQPADVGRRFVGWALLVYAFAVYPVLNAAFGHGYPTMPTFGAPCPTTIAAFGLMAWATPRPPWLVWVVPVLWALIGTSAALVLSMPEDLGLPAAAILALTVQFTPRSSNAT